MADEPGVQEDEDLETLLNFVRDARGFDFTGYKRSSLARRIRKRMQDVSITEYTDYRDLLEASAEEFSLLFNTILINVTSFFRDTETWSYLQNDVLPELLEDAGQEIRVWSAGCSSGEEAYSLAIAFTEALGVEEFIERVKIYATDVDEEALADARTGVYPAKALEPLTAELRERYFEPSGSRFAFRADLRRRVIFGRHDITGDAPISRLDLLVCRNTLMYFNVETQKQIINRFHFALRERGYLFLGKAEMLLSDGQRFDVASMRRRVFKRTGGRTSAGNLTQVKFDSGAGTEAREAAHRRLLRDLVVDSAPNAQIVLDDNETVFLVNGQARAQFGLNAQDVGRPFRDLEVSYRPTELRSLVEQARTERRTIRLTSVERRRGDDDIQYFEVLIQPLWSMNSLWVGTAITFIETTFITRLQQDLKRHREDLETAYEELQSTNEELETTNEELQSGNEELETMNEEMRSRTSELEEARTFLEGVLSSVAAGVVVLDGSLRIHSWNRGAQELWGLRADEVYQQEFFALDIGLPTEQLRSPIERCLESKERSGTMHIDAVNRRGRAVTCLVSCSPLNGQGHGVVLLMEETGDSE